MLTTPELDLFCPLANVHISGVFSSVACDVSTRSNLRTHASLPLIRWHTVDNELALAEILIDMDHLRCDPVLLDKTAIHDHTVVAVPVSLFVPLRGIGVYPWATCIHTAGTFTEVEFLSVVRLVLHGSMVARLSHQCPWAGAYS